MDSAASPPKGSVENVVEGYCVHCRKRQKMLGAIQVTNRRGGPALKGHCSICGKTMYRLGSWNSLSAGSAASQKEE